MRHRPTLALLVAWILACAGPTPSGDPADPVRRIYASYAGTGAEWLPYASAGLARDWAAATARAEESACEMAPIHEADVLVDGQDAELANVVVDAEITGDRAVARARFENLGTPREVRFDLLVEDGAWRIDDVHASGPSLREQIRATLALTDTDC